MKALFSSERVRDRLSQVFGLDTRSLAIARIALGLLVILDVLGRLVDYETFYTDAGVLSRAKTLELYHRSEYISLFMASGASWWAGFCFLIEAVAGACFLLGYRTRLSGAIAWFMMIGCHARFSNVLQAGDLLLRLLLFWSLFLPMGARLSIDRMKNRVPYDRDRVVYGIGSVALIFQVLAVYVWTALLKTGKEWHNGEAVYYALRLDYFAKQPFTDLVLSQEWLWRGLTHATFYVELYGPILVFVPLFFGFVRTFVVVSFVGMHIGFWAGMELGLFPWISITSWLFLLPAWFWDKCGWRLSATENGKRSLLGWDWSRRAGSRAGLGGRLMFSQLPILLFLWISFQWNMTTIDGKKWRVTGIERTIALTLRLDQRWSMFAPYPIKDGGWHIIPGKLLSGEEVELWQGGEPKWATEEEKATWTKVLPKEGQEDDVRYRLSREHPEDISGMYPNQRWRKYMRRIWAKKHKALRLPLGQYFCRTWNAEHSGQDKLSTFKIVFMKDPTPKPGEETEVEPVVIWSHNCFKSTKSTKSTDASKSAKKPVDVAKAEKRLEKPTTLKRLDDVRTSNKVEEPGALPAAPDKASTAEK